MSPKVINFRKDLVNRELASKVSFVHIPIAARAMKERNTRDRNETATPLIRKRPEHRRHCCSHTCRAYLTLFENMILLRTQRAEAGRWSPLKTVPVALTTSWNHFASSDCNTWRQFVRYFSAPKYSRAPERINVGSSHIPKIFQSGSFPIGKPMARITWSCEPLFPRVVKTALWPRNDLQRFSALQSQSIQQRQKA